MPISVKCTDCGKSLKAPDALAGKKAKCPDCGAVVPIPTAALDAENFGDELVSKPKPKLPVKTKPGEGEFDAAFDDLAAAEAEAPVDDNAKRRPCPMCGELIANTAAKCRYCGEFLDPELRKQAMKKNRSSASSEDELTGVDIALCILCAGIGCIVGIVALIRGQSSRGGKMIGISLLAAIGWNVISFLIQQMNR